MQILTFIYSDKYPWLERPPCINLIWTKKQIPKKDILRMQDMLQNKTQVETVNFRLYFKVWNKVENLQFQPASCFEAHLAFPRCLFRNLLFTLLFSAKFLRNFAVLWWVAKIYISQSVSQWVSHSVNSGGLCKFRTRCLNVILTRF